MSRPKLSIIIPAFNIEQYIACCIESILKQVFKDFEIIAVDDGSTDKTPEILDSYAERYSFIKVIHKPNGGVSSARLAGISIASGEYIGFVDGDDMLEPEMYSVLIENAEKYGADISHCGYKMVFPSRTVEYHGTGQIIEQDSKKGMTDLLDGSLVEPGLWNKIYKKELIDRFVSASVMDTSVKINEDLLMNYYLFKIANNSVFEDKCLYNYMIHKNSAATSSVNTNKIEDPIKVLEIICGDVKSDGAVSPFAKKRYTNALIDASTRSCKENKQLIKPYQKRYRKELRARLGENLRENSFSFKYKLKILFASLLPDIYKLIHTVYLKATGLDKIYDIN